MSADVSPIEERVVVITGAGHGIGAALARESAARGASRIILCDIDTSAAASTAASIGDRAEAQSLDVADTAAVFDLADGIVDRYGVPGLVCANAG